MKLIIVSGLEATGKSAIGREVAKRLGYGYYGKDAIKEKLYDTERHSTWDHKWYEAKAKNKFFDEINSLIKNRQNIVIESNFIDEDRIRLQNYLDEEVNLIEIYCRAKGMTSLKRFIARNESGRRHKGHHDRRWYPTIFLEDVLQYFGILWPSKPSGLTPKLLNLDSSDFNQINYDKIIDFINAN